MYRKGGGGGVCVCVCVCVCVGGGRRGVEKVKLGGEVGVYDGCVGMGMCVVWGN